MTPCVVFATLMLLASIGMVCAAMTAYDRRWVFGYVGALALSVALVVRVW